MFPNSPAHLAGLIAHEDYLLGTCDTVLKGYSDLEALLTAHAADADANGTGTGTAATTTAGAVAPKRPLTLCVFNAISRSTREVALEPRLGWGGAGLLGCNIGHGWLHRLPLHSAATIAAALSAAEQMSEPITVEVRGLW